MTDKAISPLRQRMIEDMTIRKLAPKTQRDYVQPFLDLGRPALSSFPQRSPSPRPEDLTPETAMSYSSSMSPTISLRMLASARAKFDQFES